MIKKKSIISILLCLVMMIQVLGIIPVYASTDYDNHWAKSQIENLIKNDVITGYRDGSIKPDNVITRAEFVTLTNKIFKYEGKSEQNFKDIQGNEWYAEQFLIAKEAGYLSGDDKGNANPNSAITRAEVCVIVSKALNLTEDTNLSFKDNNEIPVWAKPYIGAMAKSGIVQGYPDGSFGASKNIKRAEAFVIVYNTLAKIDNVPAVENSTVTTVVTNDNNNETTDTTTETTTSTLKASRGSSGGGGGGGGSSQRVTTTTEATTEVSTDAITETTTQTIIDGGSNVSRQEWINSLVSTLGLSLKDNITVENSVDTTYNAGTVLENYETSDMIYNDISNAEYNESIRTAYEYGIITKESDSQSFNPDAPATREFVAVTAVKALGFINSHSDANSWNDGSELVYPEEDTVAVETGIITLVNNSFLPNEPVKEQLKNYVVNKITEINTVPDIDLNSTEQIEYVSGVKNLTQVVDYTVSGSAVVINSYTEEPVIAVNDTIVLPATTENPTGYVIVADEVATNDGVITVNGHLPDSIWDVISSIKAEGSGGTVVGDIQVDDGFIITDLPENRMARSSVSGTTGKVFAKSFGFDKTIMNGNGNVKGNISLKIPSIDYKIDAGLSGIKDLYFVVNQEAQASGEVTITGSADGLSDEKWHVATIPYAICPGVNVNINVWLTMEASGKCTISYTVDNQYGLQVINNNFRVINNCDPRADARIEGSLKLGANLGIMLNVGIGKVNKDIADISTCAGVGAKAYLESHTNPTMTCIDGKVYLFWNISALENSWAGELLNTNFNKEIYNLDNSPLKKIIHLESREDTDGFVIVPECTYGIGTLSGYVAKATDRTEVIPNATSVIYNMDGYKLKKLYSDSNGEYSCKLRAGNYKLIVSAEGYIPYEYSFSVESGNNTYAETLLMIDESAAGQTGRIYGSIQNSVTGVNVPNVDVKIYKNWNNTSTDLVYSGETDASGSYSFNLESGNYTMVFSKDEYISTNRNITVIPGDNLYNYYLVPVNSEVIASGDLRIQLTWGSTPRDLDSHLVGPSDTSDSLHTYFIYKSHYGADGNTYAALDHDDTAGNGCETTTIYKSTPGVYSFYVHDYTNKNYSDVNQMSTVSGAQVKLYAGDSDREIAVFNIPNNQAGTVWHVFDYDSTTNVIRPVNTFSYCSYPSQVGMELSAINESVSRALGLNNYSDEIEPLKDYEIAELEQKNVVDNTAIEDATQNGENVATEAVASVNEETTEIATAENAVQNNENVTENTITENNNEITSLNEVVETTVDVA